MRYKPQLSTRIEVFGEIEITSGKRESCKEKN
jgi:hypothetical protein